MITVIDYDTGNLRSVCNAISRLGVEYEVTDDLKKIRLADKVIMPGVGEASTAMQKLRERGLAELIPTLQQPVLGICIGMQLMCVSSEEGNARCLGLFNAEVKRFVPDKKNAIKVPHMGWNQIKLLNSQLFTDIEEGSFVYFVHSYAPSLCEDTVATSENGATFSAALQHNNFYGVQFHPEKSGSIGAKILTNFLKL